MSVRGIALKFSVWCLPVRAWKFRFQNSGSFPLKILEPKKLHFNFAILVLYREYFQIVTSYRQLESGVANCNVSINTTTSLGVLWSTNGEKYDRSLHPPTVNYCCDSISGVQRLNPIKILQMLQNMHYFRKNYDTSTVARVLWSTNSEE